MQQHRYSSPIYLSLKVARSPISGKGLFASKPIPTRSKIGEFEGELITVTEARKRAAGRSIVAIVELDRLAIDAGSTTRGFRYINHSCRPNTFIRIYKQHVEFYALRRIRSGEELTVDYGDSHHEGRLPCRCGAGGCRGWL